MTAARLANMAHLEAMEDGSFLLFDYKERDPLWKNARTLRFTYEETCAGTERGEYERIKEGQSRTGGRILARLDAEYGTEYRCYLDHETPWQLLIAVILSASVPTPGSTSSQRSCLKNTGAWRILRRQSFRSWSRTSTPRSLPLWMTRACPRPASST